MEFEVGKIGEFGKVWRLSREREEWPLDDFERM
jgi:hypothetical protein